jgi:hypothetical protein
MNREKLKKILEEHAIWLKDSTRGKKADLRGANLDFSCFSLSCKSFFIKDDGRLAKQLLSHIARLDVKDKKLSKWIKTIPKEYVNDICERHNIEEV